MKCVFKYMRNLGVHKILIACSFVYVFLLKEIDIMGVIVIEHSFTRSISLINIFRVRSIRIIKMQGIATSKTIKFQ